MIFSIQDSIVRKESELGKNGHSHSVWEVSWSEPILGNYLASVGYDKKVIIWKENTPMSWEKVYSYNHSGSVNSCEFGPKEYGLILLCGSSDGTISLHELIHNEWSTKVIQSHSKEVNSVSWGSSFLPIDFQDEDNYSNAKEELAPMRFASGGTDNIIKVWTYVNKNKSQYLSQNEEYDFNCFKSEALPNVHSNIIRSLSWLKYVGYSYDTIATGGEDGIVVIWKKKENKWEYQVIKISIPIWTISWSHCGSYLAITTSDNKTVFYQENMDEKWEKIPLS